MEDLVELVSGNEIHLFPKQSPQHIMTALCGAQAELTNPIIPRNEPLCQRCAELDSLR